MNAYTQLKDILDKKGIKYTVTILSHVKMLFFINEMEISITFYASESIDIFVNSKILKLELKDQQLIVYKKNGKTFLNFGILELTI
jgi:hypothetical protein